MNVKARKSRLRNEAEQTVMIDTVPSICATLAHDCLPRRRGHLIVAGHS
jgi:hypothetical protein